MQPDMPKRQFPYLNNERDRHGKRHWIVRVGKGRRIRLQAEYGTEEFLKEYTAALNGEAAAKPKAPGVKKGSLRWLADRWRESSDWHRAAPATQRQRENILYRVMQDAGDVDYTDIDEQAIEAGRERRMRTPFAANNFLKTMKALFKWAKASRFIDEDPAKAVALLSRHTKGFRPWTLDDLERFRQRWPLGTRERLAVEILANTGLRRGDAVRLGRQHVRDGIISIKTEKTGVWVYPPVLPALQEAIDAGPIGDLTFIVNAYGRPMAKESFGIWFREACNAAGVPGSAHGLRKLAATIVADNGGSELELQALFGWISKDQSATYTRDANNKRLAIQAAAKLNANKNRPHLPASAPAPRKKIENSDG